MYKLKSRIFFSRKYPWRLQLEAVKSHYYLICVCCRESDFDYRNSIRCKASASDTPKWKVPKKCALTRNNHLCRYLLRYTPNSQFNSERWYKPKVVSARSSSGTDQPNAEDEQPMAKAKTFTLKIEFSRIDCLVWFLHESAKSFSLTIQTLESARRGPELAMAWVGVDVHSWHKNISYQVCRHAQKHWHWDCSKEHKNEVPEISKIY